MLPASQCESCLFVRAEVVAAPELFGVDSMTTLDLSVLLGAPRLYVAMLDARFLHGQREPEREFRTVVRLEFPDGEGQVRAQLAQEGQARGLVAAPVEAQDSIPGAVVDRRVLIASTLRGLDDFDIDLDGVARILL